MGAWLDGLRGHPPPRAGVNLLKTELFQCEGDCGVLYPLLVDRRGGNPTCAACGSHARTLSEIEVMDRLRTKVSSLFGEGAMPASTVGRPVNVQAKVNAARELGEMLRYLETTTHGPVATLRPAVVEPAPKAQLSPFNE